MTLAELIRRRLGAHRLTGAAPDPVALVSWFGCLQAQDYRASLWAVGVRTRGSAATVEQALADGTILRTWPMRGTLHLVAAADARWMLALMAPRAMATAAGRHRQLGLTDHDFAVARDALFAALAGGRRLLRAQAFAVVAAAGVPTDGQRGMHIIGRLAHEGVLCVGPRVGQQPTYRLLTDVAGPPQEFDREQSLAEITRRYVRSHGPVTAHDLAFWTGLTLTDARAGLASVDTEFSRCDVDGVRHWFADDGGPLPRVPSNPLLLGRFDEYVLGYRVRDAVLDPDRLRDVVPGGNGIFMSTVVERGRVTGIWRVDRGQVVVSPFSPPAPDVSAAARRYRQFAGA